MIGNRACVFALLVIVTLFSALGSAAAATVNCPQVPNTKWWGKTPHKEITNYVNSRNDGDWVPYIEKWNRQLKAMREIYKRGGSAVFKKKGVTIKGPELEQYIKDIKVRLLVSRCLALKEFEKDAQELRKMETASGGDEPSKNNQ